MDRSEPTPLPGAATIGGAGAARGVARAGVPDPTPVEGFALESRDGLVFTVKGHLHPPGRTVAYLRYAPDPTGTRVRDGVRYRRLYAFGEQIEELARRGGDYVVDDPILGVRLQTVPDARVVRVYDPRERLRALREAGPRDAVEEAALGVCGLVERESGVAPGCLGVTGSLLFGLHDTDSDVDLVVYGSAPSLTVAGALARLLREDGSPLRLPDLSELAALGAAHREDTPLAPHDFVRLQRRKVNESRYAGRSVFVRFVKLPRESSERYGDARYETAGRAGLRARVTDAADALFSPSAYRVDSVRPLAGEVPSDLTEIVSFRGRFAEQARTGELVEARGAVELVHRADGTRGARLTVGGARGDYLLSGPLTA